MTVFRPLFMRHTWIVGLTVSLIIQASAFPKAHAESTVTVQDRQHHTWRLEAEKTAQDIPPSRIEVSTNGLQVWAQNGLTLWLLLPLHGNYTLSFDRKIFKPIGNFRVSDMNIFWNAHEKDGGLPRPRNGTLAAYNSLVLEYAGIGGNANTTTRFRHYDGSGNRILLQESKDQSDLLVADHVYHTIINVRNGTTSVSLDGSVIFSGPVISEIPGYFGIRTVGSWQEISHLSVSK